MANGSFTPVDWSFKDRYLDEYTQEVLPEVQIKEAIVDEMCYFNQEVWVGVDQEEARRDTKG